MTWGAGTLSLLVAVVGAALLIVTVLRGRRWARRRIVGMSGTGLLLLGLSLSGVVDVVARALAIFSLNPVRWVGLVLALVGFLMLSFAGLLPLRRGSGHEGARPVRKRRGGSEAVTSSRDKGADPVDADLAEIEAILRRRGIE